MINSGELLDTSEYQTIKKRGVLQTDVVITRFNLHKPLSLQDTNAPEHRKIDYRHRCRP